MRGMSLLSSESGRANSRRLREVLSTILDSQDGNEVGRFHETVLQIVRTPRAELDI
jgi:hypothetical protein